MNPILIPLILAALLTMSHTGLNPGSLHIGVGWSVAVLLTSGYP